MHVMLSTELYFPGTSGVVTAVRNLAEALRCAGHEVTVVAPASKTATLWAAQNKVHLHSLTAFTLPANIQQRASIWMPNQARAIRTLLRRCDLLHLHTPVSSGIAIGRIATQEGIPIVVTNHALIENVYGALRVPQGLDFRLFRDIFRHLIEKGIRLAKLLTCPTHYAAQILRKDFGELPIAVISNGVKMSSLGINIRPAIEPDAPIRALYVGRLQREKHVDELIGAVRECLRLRIPIQLTIVGTGPDSGRLRRMVRVLGLEGPVVFAGCLDDRARDQLYETSHFLWVASRAELQCCAALEAMASGMPVIAANAGALPETVCDGFSGRLYSPGEPRQVAEIMKELRCDPRRYNELSRGAHAAALRHDLPVMCQSTLAAYASIR